MAHMVSCSWQLMSMFLIVCICCLVLCNGWTPESMEKLQDAIQECLQLSTDCSEGEYGPIGSWDVSAVDDMTSLFDSLRDPSLSAFNGDVAKWDVSSVTSMEGMFSEATSFDGDLSKWNTASVTTMEGMFTSALLINCDLSKWDVSRVTNMVGMFWFASSFSSDISKWDVSSVTNMENTFNEAILFNSDLSKWDVSSVTNMFGMFAGAASFNCDITKWDVSKVTSMYIMFSGASSFEQTLCGKWMTSTADKAEMFDESPGRICSKRKSESDWAPESNTELRESVMECASHWPRSSDKNALNPEANTHLTVTTEYSLPFHLH